jgi:hypothetical protein
MPGYARQTAQVKPHAGPGTSVGRRVQRASLARRFPRQGTPWKYYEI